MVALTLDRGSESPAAGYAGAFVTVLIWAGWILATRHTAATNLGTIDLGLIRFGIPALVLAPVWLKTGLLPKSLPLALLALMVAGSGAVFFQVAAFAIHATPAASVGVLLGGSMPLATAIIGMTLFRERPARMRLLGFAAIVAGMTILLVRSLGAADASAWAGYLLLPAAATLWATYTHAFRHSGLNPLEGSALIAVWSFLLHLVLALVFGSTLGHVPAQEIGLQVMSQGFLSGLVAMLAYGLAVRRLGGTQAAAFTALTPVLAMIGGGILLGETIGPFEIAAAVVTAAGVALSTGILSARQA
ncbi:membrane protein [Sinorhizobium fredii USDA 205]|uniref:EamA family transporter n=1 Tax=Rhizobium fredii TaxID=380 RepID=A0A844ALV1_RHIFR|nr:DMT family transporter [Sinorhizobium fredii]AWM24212.1 Permease of the drug/metabolite transporter (DMT) superfamily [Sinorhizobium fredii CCBAU 25509]KSV81535.1 membrane protein [Sinorhizobium fredii USDA 205]MCG5475009.1 DMT family transporter [Sinorhizobium fredii]MQW96873.1 EamA family transporter [Sinorhizobium fredii]MQX13067.1 EamA family transporter [Sinorhizobium fredii]